MDSPKLTNHNILILRFITGLLALAFFGALSVISFMYLTTPSALRKPMTAHFHFRMDLVVAGKSVNFADNTYQTEFNTDLCSALLTKQPIHFHDHINQFVHIHWAGITGGEVLKNYGWNMIGGLSDSLGWRFDKGNLFHRIQVHGHVLPVMPEGAKKYIYVGDASSYTERTWESFLQQPLQVFFQAPLDDHHSSHVTESSSETEKLVQLNHVDGSTVIFVQKDRPTETQIKDHFNHLEPLPQTQCAD